MLIRVVLPLIIVIFSVNKTQAASGCPGAVSLAHSLPNDPIVINFNFGSTYAGKTIAAVMIGTDLATMGGGGNACVPADANGKGKISFPAQKKGAYIVHVGENDALVAGCGIQLLGKDHCSKTFNVTDAGVGSIVFNPTCDGGGKYIDQMGDPAGIDTALGCLPTDPQEFVGLVLPWAIGIGGGIAFLLMLYGVFMIIVSSGVPDKMQAGRELITSAITGLLIIIFAVFILKFIGVDVLGLFTKQQ